MGRNEHREQMRCQVERLLATDMKVTEWCDRNRVSRQTMYYWLAIFAEDEPELFGGVQNVVDSSKRRWVESTRKNMAASTSLATTKPAEIVIIDSGTPAQVKPPKSHETSGQVNKAMHVDIKGASVSIPVGANRADIENVLTVLASL